MTSRPCSLFLVYDWPGGGAAVLVVTLSCHLPLVAVTRLAETLLEVVRQEGVQHGVDGWVAVLEAVGQEDDDDEGVALVVTGRFAENNILVWRHLELF